MSWSSSKKLKNYDVEWDPTSFFKALGYPLAVKYGESSWLPSVASSGRWYVLQDKWTYEYNRSETNSNERESLELLLHKVQIGTDGEEWDQPSPFKRGGPQITEHIDMGNEYRVHSPLKRGEAKFGTRIVTRGIALVIKAITHVKLMRAIKRMLHELHPFWREHVKIEKDKGPNYCFIRIVGHTKAGTFIEKQFAAKMKAPEFDYVIKAMEAYVEAR